MSPSPVPQVRLSIVAAFPKNYFLENLAIRADNSVLVTALNHKELWYVPSSPNGIEVAPRHDVRKLQWRRSAGRLLCWKISLFLQ